MQDTFHVTYNEKVLARIDKFLSTVLYDYSRVYIQSLIKEGHVFVNGIKILEKNHRLSYNDNLTVTFKELHRLTAKVHKAPLPFSILFEDDHMLVIDKEPGLVVHPGAGHHGDTLSDILIDIYSSGLSDVDGCYPGIVHRLDKDTSGVMIIAKNNIAHHKIALQIASKDMIRKYIAFIFGYPGSYGTIKTYISRSKNDKTKMCVLPSAGKYAVTHYNTLEVFGHNALSLVEFSLETGRTHQIRVHMDYIKHHIIGDKKYIGGHNYSLGNIGHEIKRRVLEFPRQALHSSSVTFVHPMTNILTTINASLHEDMKSILNLLHFIS